MNLQSAIEAGKALGTLALYFGCFERMGHFLHHKNGLTVSDSERAELQFPWSDGLLDGGLLINGKRQDIYDGKVFWTAGGSPLWYAFFWWDRSIDRRGAANSGLYVRGFGWPEAQLAFDYACDQFPKIVGRQAYALTLQNPEPPRP